MGPALMPSSRTGLEARYCCIDGHEEPCRDNRVCCRALAQKAVKGEGLPLILSSTPSGPQKPTTGLLAITLALHLCDLVHIAGFGYPDAHNRKQTIHYYEQITLKSMAVSCPPLLSWGGAGDTG